MMKLDEMRVLVTGATGGIGRALVGRLLEAGAFVLVHGRNERRLQEFMHALDNERATSVTGDLTLAGDRQLIVDCAVRLEINTVVNNAGINEFRLFEAADVDAILRTNVIGPMMLTQALAPHLKARDSALVVNVGSPFGSIGYPGYVAYCASKHAIKGFSEALRRELSDTCVDVRYLSPRATRTAMNSEAAMSANEALGIGSDSAESVAEAIVLALATDKPRFQIGRQERMQIRLNALFPGAVDGAIARQLPLIKQYAG